MNSAVCTLFEGHYHHGLGALVNSLWQCGFRGVVYAGYRGSLPPWTRALIPGVVAQEFRVADGLGIHFLPLTTRAHLTNFKPDFMLEILQRHSPGLDALFFFDSDMTIKCRWSFFEEWVSNGVALCEDVNSPMPGTHPIRGAWRRFYAPHQIQLRAETDCYLNAGFLGLRTCDQRFLSDWKAIQELMEPAIGGMQNVNVQDRTFLFYKTDQDALNVTAMATTRPLSIVGKDGMDFVPGGCLMSHALGGLKPWRKRMLIEAFRGVPPSLADKSFWSHVSQPIRLCSPFRLALKRLELNCAAAIGRAVRRS